MKNFLFVLFTSLICTVTKAQLRSNFDSTISVFKNKINHGTSKIDFQKLVDARKETELNDDFVVHLQQPALQFQYNISGFDIFQATPGDIYVIKPDSTVAFNLPVADLPKTKK